MVDMNGKPMQHFLAYVKMRLLKKEISTETKPGAAVEDIIRKNRLIKLLCEDMYLTKYQLAQRMRDLYGYDMGGFEVLQMLRSFRISKEKRGDVLRWAEELGKLFMQTLATGRTEDYQKTVNKLKKTLCYRTDRHGMGQERDMIQDRFACMKLCVLMPEMGRTNQGETVEKFGYVFAKYYLDDIMDALADYCGEERATSVGRSKRGVRDGKDAAAGKVARLERALERSDMMLRDLQAEFDERLEESKIRESAEFFSRLNSEKYGCILDELLSIRRGVMLLKKQNYELPPEIAGLFIMTQKLTQFVRDSGINPIMKPQEIKTVTAGEIDFCDYEGTPFASAEDKKQVRVISPGWIYAAKELQIARPKVKEVAGEA